MLKILFIVPLLIAMLINLPAPSFGHGMRTVQLACPICGTEYYYLTASGGGTYLFESPSRFQYLFWPFIEPEILWTCQKCHFSCLMGDFNKIPKEKISKIEKTLESVVLPVPVIAENIKDDERQGAYRFISMSARIPVAEIVYKILGQNDYDWCLFYRMAAYHYDKEDKPEKASEARQKALEYAEKRFTDKSQEGMLKELYLISGAMRYFLGDFDGARNDFVKGRSAIYHNPSMSADYDKMCKNGLDYILDQFLDSPDEAIDLIMAIYLGKSLKVAEILDRNPDLFNKSIERKGSERREEDVPLHFAVISGNLDMVKLLILRGADVNMKAGAGYTPLFLAIDSYMRNTKHLDMIKLLLDSGADIQARCIFSVTPLIYAIKYASGDGVSDIVSCLISRGAEVNSKDDKGMTPLHCAIMNRYNNNLNIVKLLISQGADISSKNNKGETPMMCARKKGLTEIVELLQSHGARE